MHQMPNSSDSPGQFFKEDEIKALRLELKTSYKVQVKAGIYNKILCKRQWNNVFNYTRAENTQRHYNTRADVLVKWKYKT